ncbi:MAG: hypothetical protein NVSMB19_25250 [Vulcanimicrobiaceae bacterium]
MFHARRRRPARRVLDARRAYRYVFLVLGLFALLQAALLASLVAARRDDARAVDANGLQPTRSQQIAFLAARVASPDGTASERRELTATVRALRAARPLASRGAAELQRAIVRYADEADAVGRGGAGAAPALRALTAARLGLLNELDRAVRVGAARSAASNDRIVVAIVALTALLLAAAGIAWCSVIVPFERRAQRAAGRLRALFENNPEAIATYDLGGLLRGGNAASMRLVGLSADAVRGVHFADHVAFEALPATTLAFARTIGGEATEFQTTLVRADGERRTVLANLFPNSIDGKIVGVYAIVRDITALEHARAALRDSEQRFRSLFEHNPDAIAIIDPTGTYVGVNPAMEQLTGIPAAAFAGKRLGSLGNPDALQLLDAKFEELRRGRSVEYETTIADRTGRARDVHGRGVPITYGGEVHGFFALSRDVTEERRASREIVEGAERLAELYLVAASSGRSSDEQIASALELGRARLGYDRGYVVHARDGLATVRMAVGNEISPAGTIVPLERTLVRHCLAAADLYVIDDADCEPWLSDPAMGRRRVASFVAIPITVDGVVDGGLTFACDAPRSAPLTRSDRDFVRLIGALVGSSIERGRQRAKLDALAFFDSLTGLPNRVLFDDRIANLIAEARNGGAGFALLFVDLDGFKGVNDAHGHGAGDDVLQGVAQRLGGAVGPGDTVARLGGDEFVILLPDVRSVLEARALAERVSARLSEPYTFGERTHVLGGSIGIALYPDHGVDALTLMEHADRALYRAKLCGGGSYAVYGDPLPQWTTS